MLSTVIYLLMRLSFLVNYLLAAGGTAFNGVVVELTKFTTRIAHVLPVSDDGGSTAESVRVLGLHIIPVSFKLC